MLADLDVVHLPREAGQKIDRHELLRDAVAAHCGVCGRLVMRWSRMGPHERRLYSAGIRAQMAVARIREQRGSSILALWGSGGPPSFVDSNDAKAVAAWLHKTRGPLTCPAHGEHPHEGAKCLDCPTCTS